MGQKLTKPAAARSWPWHKSLRGKLTVAFLSIVALFSMAKLASNASFARLRGSLDSIHDTTLPRVLALQEVEMRVPELVGKANTVQAVSTPARLRQISESLGAESSMLMDAIEGLDAGNLPELVKRIDDDLALVLQAKQQALDAARESTAASASFASAAADLAENLEGDLIQVLARGASGDAIRDLRAQILTAVTELSSLPGQGVDDLDRIERRYEIVRRACVPKLATLDASVRSTRAEAFRKAFLPIDDPVSPFVRQRSSLEAKERVLLAMEAGSRSGEALKAQAAQFADEAAAEIDRSRASALSEAQRARWIEIGFFTAALIVSALILLLYVRGRIALRMEQLSDDLARLSTGDLDVEVRGGGDMEVAKLAAAAEVFRKNAKELDQTLKVLENRNATLNEFAYVASHDLKSPMRGIAQLADWIHEDCSEELSEDGRDHLMMIRKRIERMESLLEDLLRYARLGNDEKIMEELHLQTQIQGVLELMSLPPSVSVAITGADRSIRTIAAPLQLCLRNLIQNAVRYSDQERPAIRIEIADLPHQDSAIRISVEDNGPGIPADQREEAFRIFRKLQHGGDGTGMGLALTKRSAELMGGEVRIESADPRGARIVIDWPIG
jgi:signal transduction histidine kinase